MPTTGWARITILLFVALSFVASLLGASVGHGAAKYATVGAVITGVTLILLVIERWAWRWPGVRSVLRMPDIDGTWRVELESNYAGEGGGEQTIYLVVHQTYSTVVVEVLTARVRSCSDTASLARRGPRFILAYVYRAEPEAIRRDGNEPHRGAAELLIETGKQPRFEGDYWTDRGHVGRLRATGWRKGKCGSFNTAVGADFDER
jgi:hypothetical protein